jgi:hypothetical protein
MESLEDNFIGVRRAKQYKLDLADPATKKKLLQTILPSIYGQTEIEYNIKILKSYKNEQT